MDLNALRDTPPWDWPEDTDKMLLDILRDDRFAESDRLLAAELAGDFTVASDEMVDALLAIARSGDATAKLRGMALISLGPALEDADTFGFEDTEPVPITEGTFEKIKGALRELYFDADVPEQVRRQALEASVRAPQDWHADAVRTAFSSGDESWRLTAVFCMRFVRGFDQQILEALGSKDPDMEYEAVRAAGNWGVDAAWSHVATLVSLQKTDKALLLAAIEAAASIRPQQAAELLDPLLESGDDDVVEAVYESLALAEGVLDEDDDDDYDDYEDDEDDRRLH